MIKILYDQESLELVYAVASVTAKHQYKHVCLFIPVNTEFLPHLDLRPKLVKAIKTFDRNDDDDDDYFNDGLVPENNYLLGQSDQDKIILLGLHPKNPQDESAIVEFIDKCSDDITLWIDNHAWPKRLLKYINDVTDKLVLDEELSCLEILAILGYHAPRMWIRDEKAIAIENFKNKRARRYLQALAVSRVIDKNASFPKMSDPFIFSFAVHELLTGYADNLITNLADTYMDMKVKTEKAKQRLSDKNPAFSKAKKMGRSVGCLVIRRELENYLDIEEVLKYGQEKYPWLCIIAANVDGKCMYFARSSKLEIHDILSLYKDVPLDFKSTLRVLNAEVVTHGAERKRNLKV